MTLDVAMCRTSTFALLMAVVQSDVPDSASDLHLEFNKRYQSELKLEASKKSPHLDRHCRTRA
jgi:hypothetical protein